MRRRMSSPGMLRRSSRSWLSSWARKRCQMRARRFSSSLPRIPTPPSSSPRRQQEREADTVGAAIFFATDYDLRRALALFDKLSDMESRAAGRVGLAGQASDTHDSAATRKQIVATAVAELQALQARKEQR